MVVETFGPFVIPAAIFLVGVVFYALVIVVSRWQRGGSSGCNQPDGRTDE